MLHIAILINEVAESTSSNTLRLAQLRTKHALQQLKFSTCRLINSSAFTVIIMGGKKVVHGLMQDPSATCLAPLPHMTKCKLGIEGKKTNQI